MDYQTKPVPVEVVVYHTQRPWEEYPDWCRAHFAYEVGRVEGMQFPFAVRFHDGAVKYYTHDAFHRQFEPQMFPHQEDAK